jgi:hypothetical protein
MSNDNAPGKSRDGTPQDNMGVTRRDLLVSGGSLVAASRQGR